jgi:type IV pilus assembly protein PilC
MNKILTQAKKRVHVGTLARVMPSFSSVRMSPRFSLKEQSLFMKRLAFLINANVSLIEGLHILHSQARTRSHGRMLEQIIGDTQNGQSLAKSFSKFPRVFGQFSIHIIKVGESSGSLSLNLNYLADEMRKRQALRRKVVGAFIYPALISTATLAITGFLMVYLFPKIMPIFTSLHMTLPLTTRIVMGISNFLVAWGLEVIVVALLLSVGLMVALKRSHFIHYQFDRVVLKLPIIGNVMQYYNLANASRTLGLLLKSGVTLREALPITADTTKHLVYKRQFIALTEVVNRGEKISTHLLRNRSLFPNIFSHLVAVGERSGKLSESLVYLSELYDNEVDDFTKNLSTLIEPALMIFMGLVVGFIAVSIITPIYGITQNLHT